jgi:hypothetical protein
MKSYRVWVERYIARDLGISKEMLVSIRWYWWRLGSRGPRIVSIDILVNNMDIAMGCNRRHRKHERLLRCHSVVEKTVSFRSDNVCRVMALVRRGQVVVSLECCVEVFIREWI